MLFRITASQVAAGWTVDITSKHSKDWLPLSRTLPQGQCGYPHPPAAEAADWTGKIHEPLCVCTPCHVAAMHGRITIGDPDAARQEVQAFGGYLFAVLLGAAWDAMVKAAPQGPIELELAMPPGDLLQRLPWEMMMLGADPLAALPEAGRRVAITRVIAPGKLARVRALELPLRVLFVVGRQLDENLRPGAEYLGLLRQFEIPDDKGGPAIGVALRIRLLIEATSAQLQEAIDEFEPAVVHVVCHGRLGNQHPEVLLTSYQGTVPKEDPVDPQRFAQLLRGNKGSAPPVQAVVLNACHTGAPDDSYVSFAAVLVSEGIPVSVGMSGEVADSVCRIFTGAFYRGLIEEKDIDAAAADGRRAALLRYKLFTDNVEWARPVLFRAEGVATTFAVDRSGQEIARASLRFRRRAATEMLCDRIDCLRAFQDLCARVPKGRAFALAFEIAGVDRGLQPDDRNRVYRLGKSWLIEEVSWLAVLEGFIPVVFRSISPADDIPANLLLFAIKLAEMMDDTRERFDLERRVESSALALAFLSTGQTVTFSPGAILQYQSAADRVKGTVSTPPPNGKDPKEWAGRLSIEQAMREDIEALLSNVQQKIPQAKGVLVLIDDLHRYEGPALPLLDAVKAYGLGSKTAPAPAIFTYSTRDKAGPKILVALQERSGEFRRENLLAFQKPTEARLAYRQYLLSQNLAPTADRKKRGDVDMWFGAMDRMVQGVPSFLGDIQREIEMAQLFHVLLVADDETIIRERMLSDANGSQP
jgi:hypothetical protein